MTRRQKRRQVHKRQVKRHQKAAFDERKTQPEEGETSSLPVLKEPKRKRRKKRIGGETLALFFLSFPAFLFEVMEQKRRQVRKERSRKRRIPGLWVQPFTCWSNGECVRIWIGNRVLHLSGKKRGRVFLVPVRNLHHWGVGSGPWLSADEQVELIHLIQKKTRANPYFRVVFKNT